jgi:hypothetical protein
VSLLANKTKEFLKEIFPHNLIFEEHYINYKGVRLFFDFYIKEVDVLVEVQGQQHDRFIEHFHGDKEGFLASKRRDNLKKRYCEETGAVLIEIRSEQELDKSKFRERVWEALVS